MATNTTPDSDKSLTADASTYDYSPRSEYVDDKLLATRYEY